ncbi:MAG TPA: lysylphosphatidylglycerol synthase transmembrane domain-containing protein [Flavisolibacter sp.]|nr:lysylphosphatidylglycerol synthase transmembrane domain-containing protein [Flavisolibacter sp.]
MQSNKSIKIFIKYFLGPVLFVWLGYSIYNQITNQPQLEQSWQNIKESLQSYKVTYLLAAVLLIFGNWGIEAFKWKLLVQNIHPLNFLKSFKAVLSGVSFSVTMPNRVGEYVGRMMYMPEGSRLRTISAAIVGSISQLIVTFFIGIIGLFFLKRSLLVAYPQLEIWFDFTLYALLFIFFVITIFYLNVHLISSFFTRWFKSDKYYYLVEALSSYHIKFLFQLIVLSFIRYSIFLVQYILIFLVFNVDASFGTLAAAMSVVFLALAVIPSIALLEIGLRGEISLKLVGIFSINSLGIGLTSVTIWFMNLIIPAIAGSIFFLSIKLLKKE